MDNTTKVTFQFPNGTSRVFDTIGFVGAMTLSQDGYGAQMGAFATGDFTPAAITGLASAVIEALVIEMMNQDMSQSGAEDVLRQIIPHAVASAATRKMDASMTALEGAENPFLTAVNELRKM